MAYDAENMTSQNQPFRVENFSYKNHIVMDTMFKNLEKTDFLGVSVRNSFAVNNTQEAAIALLPLTPHSWAKPHIPGKHLPSFPVYKSTFEYNTIIDIIIRPLLIENVFLVKDSPVQYHYHYPLFNCDDISKPSHCRHAAVSLFALGRTIIYKPHPSTLKFWRRGVIMT